MKTLKFCAWIVASLFVFMLAGCSGGGSGSSDTGGGTGTTTGTLSLMLTDDPANECYQHVYITIAEVWGHEGDDEEEEGTWIGPYYPTPTLEQPVDLNTLRNGVLAQLATIELEPGLYTQMRLIIEDGDWANYVDVCLPPCEAPVECTETELKIPSGVQTGVKLVHPFEVIEGQMTELILDFDAQRSVVKAGNSDQYLLKPTIKVIGTVDNAIVSGTVKDGTTGLVGVPVTAQKNGAAPDEKDIVQSSTTTDENGQYTMYLLPGTYNIVAYEDGYLPDCSTIVMEAGGVYDGQDFVLASASTGTITGTVTVGVVDQQITLSFRQAALCDSSTGEVTSLNIADDGDGVNYSVSLPVGTYRVVASTDGKATQAFDHVVTTGPDSDLDITF